jgi:hypothetical protein
VQTFLPYADFEESARTLDAKRLGKQRVETIQEAERRRAENAVRRAERAAERARLDAERQRRRRSQAAKKAWDTRRRNQQPGGA